MTINIDKDKYYTPQEIAEFGLFPWTNKTQTIVKWLSKQVELLNDFKYSIIVKLGEDEKHGNRYFVKGEGIINIRASFDDGSLFDGR